MKVKTINLIDEVYHVTLTPSRIAKLFGCKEKTLRYKDTGKVYALGRGRIYISSDGEILENFSYIAVEIDKWRRSF